MCGIVGMAGDLRLKDNKVFKHLLIFDQVRGDHSTGIFHRNTGNETKTLKELGAPNFLWEYDETKSFNSSGCLIGIQNLLLGHNRHATMGAKSADNAHPFTFDHITGVHNGTLKFWENLHGAKDLDIDSKAVYSHIAHSGAKDLWSKLDGAASLVWWDDEEKTLQFLRNKERPMFIVRHKTRNAIMWASESWMLKLAGKRNGFEFDDEAIFQTSTNKLYTYKVTNAVCEQVSTEELAPFVPPVVKSYFGFAPRASNNRKKGVLNPLLRLFSLGTVKAGKESVGREFILTSAVTNTNGGYKMVGHTLDDETQKVEVVPLNRADFNSLFLCIEEEVYTNSSRFRVRKSNGNLVISSDNIGHSRKYGTVNDNFEDSVISFYEEKLKRVGYQCTCCGNPMDLYDAKDAEWVTEDCVVCKDCKNDPAISPYIKGVIANRHHTGTRK